MRVAGSTCRGRANVPGRSAATLRVAARPGHENLYRSGFFKSEKRSGSRPIDGCSIGASTLDIIFAYHDALMEKDGGLTKAEREMIVVATSAANQCQYCVIAHGAILRIRAKNPLIADQVAVNYRKADITPRQKAMLDFAMKVSTDAQRISEDDFAALAPHGFSDDDIWDIAAISAFFALSNRLANFTGMRPNEEFYLMGRLPKK